MTVTRQGSPRDDSRLQARELSKRVGPIRSTKMSTNGNQWQEFCKFSCDGPLYPKDLSQKYQLHLRRLHALSIRPRPASELYLSGRSWIRFPHITAANKNNTISVLSAAPITANAQRASLKPKGTLKLLMTINICISPYRDKRLHRWNGPPLRT